MGTYSEWLRNRNVGEGNTPSPYTTNNYAKYRAEKSFGLDTFESDLQDMGATINDIYSGWQTQETMNNTRSSVEEMQERINAYQSYQSKYGGTDLSDVASGYQSVLDDWDKLTSTYGYYQNADAFDTAQQKYQFDEQFRVETEDGYRGYTYDEVHAKIAEYEEGSDEYNYLTGYLGYTDLKEFDKALENLEYTIINAEGSEKEKLISYQTQLQEARNRYALDNKFDLYKDYMEEEDFEELSQYNSTRIDTSTFSGKLKSMYARYGMGYEDITYEYINNVDGIRDEIKDKARIYSSDYGDDVSIMEKAGYDALTEEEIAVYNYIYATEGGIKAQEFLDEMEVTLSKRIYDEDTQMWEKATDSGALGSTVMSVLTVPANIMGGVYGAMDTISDAIQGKEYNPYGYDKVLSNFASDTRQYVGENIAENTEGMELLGQNVPSFLYQTTMSTADSAVGAFLLRKAFAPVMGSTAFQQKAKELKEAGASEEEVMWGAVGSGAFEMVFEKLSLDKLFKIKNADSWGKIVTQTLKQAGVEGSEEMFTEIANVSWDYLVRQDSSDIMQKYEGYLARGFSESEAKEKVAMDIVGQVGWAGVGGALSGGAMGGTYSSAQYGELSSTGEQIRSNNRAQDMVDLSALTPEESETYKLYTDYANKGITADNISNAKLGNLYATTQADAYNTMRSKKATEEQKIKAMDTIKGLRSVETVKESKVASTGNTATIEGIKKVDGDTVLVTSEGDVATKDMKLSYHDAELLSYVENMSEEKANLFIAQYDGKSDLEAYADSFEMTYAYGEDGFDADTVLNNKGVLTEVQASEIYKTAISNKVTAQQKAVDDINAKYGKTVTVAGKVDDSIIDYNSATTDDSKVNWNSLTSRQRDAVTFVKGFSEATGVNIKFIKSNVVNGKRVGKNGSYNHATNTIEIDVYAGILDADTAKDSIIPTLSHEMTHWMKAKSPAMYNKMKDHIMKTLVKGNSESLEVIVNKEMNRIQKSHPDMKVTREYAIDELVARACEDMLANSKNTKELMSQLSKKEQSSFVAKVKETFKNLMEWVNELLAKYKSNSQEAKILRQYRDRLKQLSKMWDKALEEAIQTNNAMALEKKTDEQAVNEASETQWADRVEEEFNIDATIEQTDGLIAVHNLSEEKLLKTLKLGAFPMPSIAVTKASIGHKGFGSISLLFNKETIDPRFFRSNKVYSGDAWTPTYPSVSYKVNEKVEDRVRDKYYELSSRLGYDELRPLYRYAENLDDTLNRDGGENAMLERLYEDTGIMQIYLQDTGKGKVQPIEIEERTEITEAEVEMNKFFIDALGADVIAEYETPQGESPMTYRKVFLEKYDTEIHDAYRRMLSEHLGFTNAEVENVMSNTRKAEIVKAVRNAYMYTKNNGVTVQTRVDTEATNNAIREASADGYKEWIDNLFKGVEEKTGIRNNKDLYTNSGTRRSWDTLHYEETLENIIKAMKEQGEKGIGALGGNIFGASATEYGSMEEIREAGKRLRTVSQDEFEEMKNSFMDRFNKIADSLRMHEGFMALESACSLLVEAVAKYNTRDGIANYIKREGKGWTNYSEQVVDDLIELVNDIRNMPVNYFEAKPMRAVGFDEVACAVIPDNTSEKVRGELSKLNIPMKEYKAGDEDARVEAVNSVEGVQFSDRDSDGVQLSEAQQEYFKDSKIRDNNGNLKVMYHGSGASFTVFDKKKAKSSGYYGSGFYFTESSSHAQQYGSNYKVYLNITNPMQEGAKSITKAQLKKFVQEVSDNEDYGIENYGYGATVDSVTNSIYGKDDFAMITDINATCIGDMVEAIMLFNEVNGTTYDGIIVPTETVAFYPNQIKNVDNLNPTDDEDIRYSDRETDWTLKEYSAKQLEDWRGSKRIVVYKNNSQLMEFVNNAIQDGTYSKKMYFGIISDELADEFENRFGVDIHNYNCSLSGHELRKILKDHGAKETERPRGQREIVKEDFALIPYVMSKPTYIERGGSYHGKPLYNFKRDGVTVAGVVSDKHLDLFVQTMYASKKNRSLATATDEQASVNTSETTSGTASVNSIAQKEGFSQYSDRDSEIDWLMSTIDEYLSKISIEELMDDYEAINDDSLEAETTKAERAKRRVDEVNKRLKQLGLSFNGTKSLAWTDERIEKYLSGGYYGSSNPNYAQAYIAYVTPQQFLNLTVGSKNTTLDMIERESESYGELDIQKLGDSIPLSLYIEEGRVWTKVEGHEGRHRMYLLGKAGFEKVPVLLFDYKTKYNKTAKNEMKLIAQRYNNTDLISKSRNVVLNDVIPFSQGNRDLIVEKFGSGKEADIHYSDRDNVSVYDLMGQNKELQKQNAKLAEDVNRLKERLKLEKQITKGNTFNANQLRSVAKYLRNSADSTYNENALVEELKDVYSYIVESPQVDWTDLMAKCYEVAKNVLGESKGQKITNDYFKSVLDDVRRVRITLSDEQIQEAKSAYGARYRDAFMGRVMLVNNGISLDQQWQEWATMYPDIFDESVTGGDQITALSEIYDALREGAETYQQYNDAESIRAFALEIYNQYWNVSTIRTTADKYDKQIKRLNFEHRKAMNELRSDYKKRVEDQKKADAIHYGKMLNDIRRRREEEVKQAKESGKQRLADYRDRVAKNAKIEKITKNALTLNEWLTKNSKDAHVPEVMKAPVAYLLSAIDFSSKQLLGMRGGIRANTPTKKDISLSKALEQVHDMVQKINSAQIGEDEITEIYGTFADFPAGFADDIRELSSSVNDIMRTVGDNAYILNQMSLEQLETLDKMVATIKATVTKMNKFLAIRHAEGVANMSQQSINYMDSLGKAKERGKVGGKIEKMLDWGNALPYYTFKRFGEGGQKVYEALQDGWDKFAFHINEIINYAESTYTDKEVKEWEATVKEFDVLEPATDKAKEDPNYTPRYQKIQMTVPQIMSLYCLQKREQAKGHLMGGGMRIADFKVGKVNVKTVSQTEGVVLAESEIDTIINSLTDRQKTVADALQSFMNTTCTDWGNEVSMLRFGYKAFGEENYFPIQSDKNNLAVNDETEQNNSLFRLLNMSFTKGTINKANNRIVISDIFDIFSQHTSDMAKYNALALPVIDAFKWYNYKEKIQKGETQFNTKSLKQSLENAFGKESQNYIVTFLRDINGEQSAGRDVVGKGFFTNAKLASVGFNMRVVALQPTSYVRATAVIDPKYLTKAFMYKPKMKMAQKHCGIALWKSLGFYDINVQNSVTDLIKHNQTARDKVVEASMKGAEIADKLTWGYLWNACELEVRDKQRNLKVGSDEFYSAVANRLREVIYSTQVVDSTMTRSHMMRSRDGWDKMATAFMSEPTLSYNMLQDCYMDWKLTERQTGSKQKAFNKCGKKMARTIVAYTVTNMICALVESGFDIFRDDEDEITPEEFIELYLKNFLSNMNILNNIPYVKEFVSMLQGFSSSRTDTQWMQYLTYTITGFGKLLEGEGNAYTTAKDALRAFSYATGLPFYNLWRDGTALLDETELLTAEELEEMFNETIGEIFPSLKEEKKEKEE